ncbi:hypothetical protein Hanom_Chr10g00940541 [Helianthus anomalus]
MHDFKLVVKIRKKNAKFAYISCSLSFFVIKSYHKRRFWIGTTSVRVGFRADIGFCTGRVSDRNGFWANMSFRMRRVSGREPFRPVPILTHDPTRPILKLRIQVFCGF